MNEQIPFRNQIQAISSPLTLLNSISIFSILRFSSHSTNLKHDNNCIQWVLIIPYLFSPEILTLYTSEIYIRYPFSVFQFPFLPTCSIFNKSERGPAFDNREGSGHQFCNITSCYVEISFLKTWNEANRILSQVTADGNRLIMLLSHVPV